jgi:hypothetical protein
MALAGAAIWGLGKSRRDAKAHLNVLPSDKVAE